MQSAIDPFLIKIMGPSGDDPKHCLTLAQKLETWAKELRLHASNATVGRPSKPADCRFDPLPAFSRN
jgi:hypothetical protein